MKHPNSEAGPNSRLYYLENALIRIEGYARVALKRLATQLNRHNAGAVTTIWEAEDVGRILAHIATEAEQALVAEVPIPAPVNGANSEAGPNSRLYYLENALIRIKGYARVALKRLATQLNRHNAGAVTIIWEAEDVGRILAHIATEAEQALVAEVPIPAPVNGASSEDREQYLPPPNPAEILRGPQSPKGGEA